MLFLSRDREVGKVGGKINGAKYGKTSWRVPTTSELGGDLPFSRTKTLKIRPELNGLDQTTSMELKHGYGVFFNSLFVMLCYVILHAQAFYNCMKMV